jgi:Holliday junction resolvase
MESNTETIWITKASGEQVVFSKEKLHNSLQKAGAGEEDIQQIIAEIEKTLHTGMRTKEIYKKAFTLLRKRSRPIAARYKLKKAIMQLGPTGYPFEKYIAEILKYQGYDVKVGQIVKGHCVTHEVDVIAEKDNQHFMIECKFHSDSHRHCDVKIPLYIQSRFLDVEKQWKKKPGHATKFHQGWIATNTRFTSDAIQYGTCAGLYLLGWDYPKKGSLKERINLSGLHPITCLTTLTGREKKALLNKLIVLCKDLCKDEKILINIGLKASRVKKVMDEARALCED